MSAFEDFFKIFLPDEFVDYLDKLNEDDDVKDTTDEETRRKKELDDEAEEKRVLAKKAETRGRRFGRGRQSFLDGLGFGSGSTARGVGRGNLFGN